MLKEFLTEIGEGEQELEFAREKLCTIPHFAPRQVFDRIDTGKNEVISHIEI